jgi:hypothetical protein
MQSSNNPNKEPDASYDIMQLWKDLETFLSDFQNKHSSLNFITRDDQYAYETASNAIRDMIKLGRDAEATSWWYMLEKIRLGKEAYNTLPNRFGDNCLPPIEGAISCAFANEVILPFYKKCLKVENAEWLVALVNLAGINLNKTREIALQATPELEELITHYNATHTQTPPSSLRENSLFAIEVNKEVVAESQSIRLSH